MYLPLNLLYGVTNRGHGQHSAPALLPTTSSLPNRPTRAQSINQSPHQSPPTTSVTKRLQSSPSQQTRQRFTNRTPPTLIRFCLPNPGPGTSHSPPAATRPTDGHARPQTARSSHQVASQYHHTRRPPPHTVPVVWMWQPTAAGQSASVCANDFSFPVFRRHADGLAMSNALHEHTSPQTSPCSTSLQGTMASYRVAGEKITPDEIPDTATDCPQLANQSLVNDTPSKLAPSQAPPLELGSFQASS